MSDIVTVLRAAAEAENGAYLATLHSEEVRPNGEAINHYHWRRRNTLHDAADIMRDSAPENVECPTCGGAGYCVDSLTFPPEQIGQPCPDCTPENVECPRDGTPVDTVRANRNVIAHSQDALAFFRRQTPENVECPTCGGRGYVVTDLLTRCPDCHGTGRTPTPENVEPPERHNHITRDIKPLGQCPACDRYHNRTPENVESPNGR